jgi:DNA polymerase III epsilon subunit-like protein
MGIMDEISTIFIDCQTNGNPKNSVRLLEIAYNDYAAIVSQSSCPPKRILKLIGITEADISDGVAEESVAIALKDYVSSLSYPVFVAHFSSFEGGILKELEERYKFLFGAPLVCTLKMTQKIHPQLSNFSIKAVAGHWGFSMSNGKRAKDHVLATSYIWQKIKQTGAFHRLQTIEELQAVLKATKNDPKAKKTFSYHIAKENRLNLPRKPGLYRFLDADGRVLYVGKAKSLKHRVNSYFTGGIKRDYRKREMMARAWSFRFEVCESELEASVREYESIRALQPPYNVTYNNEVHDRMSDLKLLCQPASSRKNITSLQGLFPALQDLDILMSGVKQWRNQYGYDLEDVLPERTLLATIYRKIKVRLCKRRLDAAAKLLKPFLAKKVLEEPDIETEDNMVEAEKVQWTSDLVRRECDRILREAFLQRQRMRWMLALERSDVTYSSKANRALKRSPNDQNFDPRRTKIVAQELRKIELNGGWWSSQSSLSTHVPIWM